MEEGSESSFWSALTRLFRGRNELTLEDLISAAQKEGKIKTEDATMVLGILRLGKKLVSDIMVPRTDIVCAEADESLSTVRKLIIESGHSRIPIYRDSKDDIIGIIYAKDILVAMDEDRLKFTEELSSESAKVFSESNRSLESLMRQHLVIPDSKNLKETLLFFQAQRKHLAIALDEYGGTSGLVTIEDVLEEIVGEIEDEHDAGRPSGLKEIAPGEYIAYGRFSLEELNEKLNISLESEQVETLGGYLCELAGRVPKQGESYVLLGYKFTVEDANRRQIRWVRIQPDKN